MSLKHTKTSPEQCRSGEVSIYAAEPLPDAHFLAIVRNRYPIYSFRPIVQIGLPDVLLVVVIRGNGGAVGAMHFAVLTGRVSRLFLEFADEVRRVQVTDPGDDIL